jgi:TolA-binding protein
MAPIDENTNLEISLKAVISIVFAVFTLTTAFVTLDGRIISLESSQKVQDMIIKENQAFTREWPLGLRGALPDDLIQNAEIMALKEKHDEVKALREDIRRMQLEIGQLNAQTATQEEKIETLFDIWNQSIANEK